MCKLKKSFENKSSRFISWLVKPCLRALESSKIGRMAIYKSLRPNTLVVAEASNLRFLVNSSDMAVGYSTYINKIAFDSEKIGPLLTALGGGRTTLIDIGANIGTIGLTALAQGKVSEVWAFEPEPHNYSLLVSNISLNGLNGVVKAFNVALTDEEDNSELEFEIDPVNFGDHRVRKSYDGGRYGEDGRNIIRVKSARLDDLCVGLDFEKTVVWMDVQGYEGYVLCGSKRIIDSKVPIVTEFWPYGLKRSGCLEKFIDSISSGTYSNLVDVNNIGTKMRCDKSTLLALAAHYGFEGGGTDLLIY